MKRRTGIGGSNGGGSAGFTMVELLAVILVLGILMVVLITNLVGSEDAVMRRVTRAKLAELEAVLRELDNEIGDYAPSSLAQTFGSPPNLNNLGSECLYLALCAEGSVGFGNFEDRLGNTDGDALAKRPKGFETADLFEIVDEWANPVAYFHNRDYGRKDTYVTFDPTTDEEIHSVVTAQKNAQTKRWSNPTGFQLVSSGPDGVFGLNEETGENDDITNF